MGKKSTQKQTHNKIWISPVSSHLWSLYEEPSSSGNIGAFKKIIRIENVDDLKAPTSPTESIPHQW